MLVGIVSLTDLGGTTLRHDTLLRGCDPAHRLALLRTVRRTQWTTFGVALLLINASLVLTLQGHPVWGVVPVAALTLGAVAAAWKVYAIQRDAAEGISPT